MQNIDLSALAILLIVLVVFFLVMALTLQISARWIAKTRVTLGRACAVTFRAAIMGLAAELLICGAAMLLGLGAGYWRALETSALVLVMFAPVVSFLVHIEAIRWGFRISFGTAFLVWWGQLAILAGAGLVLILLSLILTCA